MTDDGPEIILHTVPHERPDGMQEAAPAPEPDEFYKLSEIDEQQARELGMNRWSESDHPDGDLWLFPGEWYEAIPEGFTVTDINGNEERFSQKTNSRDIRFGCLAYGVRL